MHDLFAQKDAFELDRARALARVMDGWKGNLPNLEIVAGMIALAETHGVKLTLVITPHHADALELYWRLGLWPRVEQLKTELADIVAGADPGVVLWDFMEYSDRTTEAVPEAADPRAATRWFWEPAHFKKQLGHLMIGRIAGGVTGDFGAILTPPGVASRNLDVRARRKVMICDGGAARLSALPETMENGCAKHSYASPAVRAADRDHPG
jgi:hypothetical protein